MKRDIDYVADLLFKNCCFNPLYMDEAFTRQRCRWALESLSDEEYEQIRKKLENKY